jgi:hypothetical protein
MLSLFININNLEEDWEVEETRNVILERVNEVRSRIEAFSNNVNVFNICLSVL